MKLLSAPELAERLGVPPSWPLEAARARRIPFVKLGKYVRFDPEAVEAWLQEQEVKPRERTQ